MASSRRTDVAFWTHAAGSQYFREIPMKTLTGERWNSLLKGQSAMTPSGGVVSEPSQSIRTCDA